jgi:putative ABC transport system permease protein
MGRLRNHVGEIASAIAQDLRHALRGLRRSPGFTVVAVLTLALGIGANTAVFSVVNGALLRALPYHQDDELVVLNLTNPAEGIEQGGVGYGDFLRWREETGVFQSVGLFFDWNLNLVGGDQPERVRGALASPDYFEVMSATPLLGRGFLPEEHVPGQGYVAVLGQGIWERRFGADPEIVGSTVYLDEEAYEVVGVVPPEAEWPQGAEIWIPLMFGTAAREAQIVERDYLGYSSFARLQPGVGVDRASLVADQIARRAALDQPDTRVGFGARAIPLRTFVMGEGSERALWLLLVCVGVVLIIACANVANLTLERSLGRQKEIAVRAAIGAGRSRSVRPLAWECLVVAGLGGAVGMASAVWGTGALASLAPPQLPGIHDVEVDFRVLSFTLAVSVITGLVFTLAPSLTAARLDLLRCLKEGGPRSGNRPPGGVARSTMSVVQIALSVVLVLGAGLIVKSTARLLRSDPGLQAEGLLTMKLFLPHVPPSADEHRHIVQFYQGVEAELEALPGVVSASAVSALPLSADGLFSNVPFQVEGAEYAADDAGPRANWNIVGMDFFETMGIPLVRGRGFSAEALEGGESVAVISQAFAQALFADEDPVGRRIRPQRTLVSDTVIQIVGVVGDVRYMDLADAARSVIYVPQERTSWREMAMVVRFRGDPRLREAEVRDAVWRVDPDVPVVEVRTMEQVASSTLAAPRFAAVLVAGFAILALTLAMVGVYGVISYSVRQRHHELGVRKALGAEEGDIGRLLVGQGAKLALLGIGIGLPAGLVLARLLSGLLFEVSTSDPAVVIGVPVLLAGVALLAAFLPARRAARIDPMEVIRQD